MSCTHSEMSYGRRRRRLLPLGLCSRTTSSPLSHWLQNVSSVPRQRASFAGGVGGVAVWSVERGEEQISRGANGIIKTEGGREGEEGRKEALVSNRKRRRAALAADWPNSQLNLQARREIAGCRECSLVQTSDLKSRVALAQAY